jgi:hypothetical protein
MVPKSEVKVRLAPPFMCFICVGMEVYLSLLTLITPSLPPPPPPEKKWVSPASDSVTCLMRWLFFYFWSQPAVKPQVLMVKNASWYKIMHQVSWFQTAWFQTKTKALDYVSNVVFFDKFRQILKPLTKI